MRRFLLIFMLLFFPLQASMAAVCAYCQEQCAFEQGGESGANTQGSIDDGASDKPVLTMDADCHCCPMSGLGAPVQLAPAITAKPQPAKPVLAYQDFHSTTHSERPERPKWTRAS
jgi:hypothetical protein